MALLCITVSGLSLSWHAQEEIKHLKINLSSYGYLALSPSLYKFWPVNSWVCQNGLTCIKRSVDHSLTMTAQFRKVETTIFIVSSDGQSHSDSGVFIYFSFSTASSLAERKTASFRFWKQLLKMEKETDKVLFLKTELNITQFLCPAALKIGFLLLLPGKLQRKCRENL